MELKIASMGRYGCFNTVSLLYILVRKGPVGVIRLLKLVSCVTSD